MGSAPDAPINAVACESCRTRKCKCDRLLPACTQCSSNSAKCTYPELHKRGFPEGYMSGIEQRLIDTETALLQALSSSPIPAVVIHRFAKAGSAATKANRMKEWQDLPLTTAADRQKWHEKKMRELDPATPTHTAKSLAEAQHHRYF